MTWTDSRLVAYDCETTGTDLENDRIVTAAIAVCGGGKETETLELLADPGIPIPAEAAAVHGITTDRARAEGLPAAEVVEQVLLTLGMLLQDERPLVVMNARFDLTILDREARRHGLQPLTDRVSPLLVIDPLVIDKHLDRFRKGSRKLDALCEHYGAGLDDAHNAAADAVAAARLAWAIGKRGQVNRRARDATERDELVALRREWKLARDHLPALHRAQVGWAWEQAVSLQEYFDRKGQDEQVESAWPLIRWIDDDELRAAA